MELHEQDLSDVWTPKLVGERLVEALRWARYNAGPTGPAPVRAMMPTFLPSDDDFQIEGWGERERPAGEGDEDDLPRAPRYSPAKISALIDALYWPAKYSVQEHPTSTRILNIWLRCKVYRGNFDKTIERQVRISRASAYRYRDRALSMIASGLTRDGVPV